MAVSTKTLTPTGQVVSIPDMTEKPNASVLADGIGKEADAINALDNTINKIDAGTYTIYLLKAKYNGVWRFWHNWTEKTRSKQVVINSCKADGTDVSVSNISVQNFTDRVQFYSTDSAFNSAENYVEFNITVTVS